MRAPIRPATIGFRAALGIVALIASTPSVFAQGAPVPAWLEAHVGESNGQIARPILVRARALYVRMRDAGRRQERLLLRDGRDGAQQFERRHARAALLRDLRGRPDLPGDPAGHGAGRDLAGVADFSNGRTCAKNFGNALDSYLTTGGAYVTAETKASFKGYYRTADGQQAPLVRSFIQFDGQGDTASARERAIGGHAAVTIKGVCLRQDPDSPYANASGYVPFGTMVDYTGGRSDGCTSWSPSDTSHIVAMVKDNPTSLYIYPDAADVMAVARAVAARQSLSHLYWNASCLRQIGAPQYWPDRVIAPLLARYRSLHPPPPPRPTPICGRE